MQNQNRVSAAESPGADVPAANRCRLVHANGRDWKVHEEPNRFSDQATERSLIFESASVIRRVRA